MQLRSNRIYHKPIIIKLRPSSGNSVLGEAIVEEITYSDIQSVIHTEEFSEDVNYKMHFEQVSVAHRSLTAKDSRSGKTDRYELDGEQPLNIRPIAPSLPVELNNETRANFQIENVVHTNEMRLWKEKDLALKHLDENLKATPAVAPIKADLKTEFEILKSTPYGKSVNNNFSRWQILSIKCQIREHSIFLTGEEDPSLALHDTLQPIHPVTAKFRANQVNDNVNAGVEIKLVDKIKAWQTFLQSRGILRFPTKLASGKNAAFSSV
ncbi:hypothetical protein EPUL_005810, partial [Erysiphe pulchra]